MADVCRKIAEKGQRPSLITLKKKEHLENDPTANLLSRTNIEILRRENDTMGIERI